jgi:small-conductance mechanosensitive channel
LLLALLLGLPTASLAQTPPAPPAPQSPPSATPAQPQQPPARTSPAPAIPEDISQQIAKLTDELSALDKAVDDLKVSQDKDLEAKLVGKRSEVQALAQKASQIIEQLRPRLDAIRQQKAKLGPPPSKDQPPEAESVANERTRLAGIEQAIDGESRRTESYAVRASQLVDSLNQLQRENFARSVLTRTRSPLLPTLWIELGKESRKAIEDLTVKLDTWATIAGPSLDWILALTVACLAAWYLLRTASRKAIHRYRDALPGVPSFFARTVTAAWVAVAIALPPVVAILLAFAGLDQIDVLHADLDRIAMVVVSSVIVFSGVTALADALLVPRQASWRLFDLSDGAASRIRWLMLWIAAVYSIDQILKEFASVIFAPLSITIAQSFLAGVAFAGLLVALVRTPFGAAPVPAEAAEAASATTQQLELFGPVKIEPSWVRLPVWVVAVGIVGAAVLGYVSLARFISGQIVVTGSIVVALILLHHAVRAFAGDLIDEKNPIGRWLAEQAGLNQVRRRRIATIFILAVQLGLILLAMPLVLLQWGFDWQVVKGWLTALLFGFKVGSIEISLARLLVAGSILATGYFGTRLVQRSLDRSVLQPPRVDAGIANSIRTAVGYLGVGASILLACSYAGLDFTNLAIVAGALSVGIGFGLQSVVNNFVSGLILLIERPIKVGDWIVVGSDEGYVRRISVRSTEIETFDRSSVIIPNAELIQGRVKNWTLHDPVGRVRVQVGIDYSADPIKAREIMLDLAGHHPAVLKTPPPHVGFDSFGPSAIELSLRVFVPDVNSGGGVRTDLAFQILQSFRSAGITMPFPQTDVHLKSLEPLKSLVAEAINGKLKAGMEHNITPAQPPPAVQPPAHKS